MTRHVIDPVTRVGGHLRLEVEISNGVVVDAWSAGTMFRGIEGILEGRDPRDAWLLAQRTCGVCVGAHALASVRAVERAVGVVPPRNARLVRNVLAGTSFVLDEVTGFYQRAALDWVDVRLALTADPADAADLALASGSGGFAATADSIRSTRDRLARLVAAGGGPLAGATEGHPAHRLTGPEGLLLLVHYLQSFDWARSVARIETLLGGKSPHPQTFLVGGIALAPPWTGTRGATGGHPDQTQRYMPTALGPDGLTAIMGWLGEARRFVDEVHLPDVIRLARTYPEWSGIGESGHSYLSYGEFPEDELLDARRLLPGGWVTRDAPGTPHDVSDGSIAETVAHSWYEPDERGHHPAEAVTRPRYEGRALPLLMLEGAIRYSWLKAPRYQGAPMETGPLARVHVAFAQGGREVRSVADGLLTMLGADRELLRGTLGRTLARAIEAEVLVARLPGWLTELRESMAEGDRAFADVSRWEPGSWPARSTGWSLGESARGALGHWVGIDGRRIESYGILDGSTWNLSPRDERDVRGPLEQALVGLPVADPARPVEILRTVHSFDPCLACGAH